MKISIEAKRLKEVRESLNMTQPQFGKQLGITTTYDIERSKTKLTGEIVYRLLKEYNINPLWLYGDSEQKHIRIDRREVVPNVITVENDGFENILVVDQKAAAGYAGNINNQEYYKRLPAFSFPIPEYRNATFRCFQVEGYSMTPTIKPNEWIITKSLEDLQQIKDYNIYVIVDPESIRIKQIKNDPDKRVLSLISINPDYGVDQINYDDVMEIWEFHSKLTNEVSLETTPTKLQSMHNDIQTIKEKLFDLDTNGRI